MYYSLIVRFDQTISFKDVGNNKGYEASIKMFYNKGDFYYN